MRRVAMTLVALLALGCGDTAGESSGSTSADDTTGEDGVAGADVPADDVTEPPDVPDTSEPEDAPASEDVLEYDAAGDPDVPINSDADSVDVPPDAGPGPGCCAGEGDCDDGQCVTSAGICKPDP